MKKESKIYLNFFKENSPLILMPMVLLAAALFYYQHLQPKEYFQSVDLEARYEALNLKDAPTLADEAVSLSRSLPLQNQIGIGEGDKVTSYKPGPMLISITASSKDEKRVWEDLNKMGGYLMGRFNFVEVGRTSVGFKKISEALFALIGAFLGSSLGILLSLIKIYFKKY